MKFRNDPAGIRGSIAPVVTPYYARPTQEALYRWYATVAREFRTLLAEGGELTTQI